MDALIITTFTNDVNVNNANANANANANDPYSETKLFIIDYLLTYKVALFYLILFINLRWFAHGVFRGHMGCIFILYTLVNTIFTLSRSDMLVTMMILLREIVIMTTDEDYQFDDSDYED